MGPQQVNPSLARVNQKLAYCRAILRLTAGESAVPANANQRLEQQALLDAGAFHLMCAYRHYLQELAEHYGVPSSETIVTEQDLLKRLQNLDKEPVEARELERLRHETGSWLSSLQAAYDVCWQPAPKPSIQRRIQVVDLDSPQGGKRRVTRESLGSWLQSMESLIDHQREIGAEY
ncbi:DUF6586 family protein [Marinimicrobium sp. ARAG 43.8]|uniref:DUF6586 family protein n=1 Tax=Marinimicrobium sp. ARAG 43.8 TaxID=3418719 RepID=UPI003CE98E9C